MSDHKYSVPDDHWEEDEEADAPGDPAVRVGTHFLQIYDERDAIERYNGLVWTPIIENGVVTGIDCAHYCPGPSHTDPMAFRTWEEVPAPVQDAILDALGADEAADIVDIEQCREVAER